MAKIKIENLKKNYILTKYLYLLIGIASTVLLIPKGLMELGVSLPNLLSFVTTIDNNVYYICFLVEKLFLIIAFLFNAVLVVVFLFDSQAKTFVRLSVVFAIILPTIYLPSDDVTFLQYAVYFLNPEIAKVAIIIVILSVSLFLFGMIYLIVKERESECKPCLCDYLSLIFATILNILFMLAYSNLFDGVNIFGISSSVAVVIKVIVKYFMLPAFSLTMGLIQIILGSKTYLSLK